jgi:hypothetical protein
MTKSQISNRAKIIVLFLPLALLAAGCNPVRTTVEKPQNTQVVNQQKSFVYQGLEGVDALTLLKQMHKVETKDFGKDLGEFVESIEGVKPGKDEFWSFYVNGKQAQVGASSYVTKKGDVIEWRLEKIQSYK